MKKFHLVYALLVVAGCAELTGPSGDPHDGNRRTHTEQQPEGIELSAALFTAGNTVQLAATDGSTVTALAIDEEGSGQADGLDLNEDGVREFIYLEGALGKALKSTNPSNIAVNFTGLSEVFYLIVTEDGVVLSRYNDTVDELKLVLEQDDNGNALFTGLDVAAVAAGSLPEFALDLPVYQDGLLQYVKLSLPVNRSQIDPSETIVVVMSASIDPASVVAGTDLVDAGASVNIITTGLADDTLVISPATGWSIGNLKVELSLKDSGGADFAPVNLRFTVLPGGPPQQ